MKVVLFQPQIPQNTGNIVRTCSVTGASLLLVKPLGFSTSSRQLRRAGLDYWEEVDISTTTDLDFYLQNTTATPYFLSSHAKKSYTEAKFDKDALLIFGSESHGLPKKYHEKYSKNFYTIPMKKNARCLNLASAAAIVLYEALRQHNFCSIYTEAEEAMNSLIESASLSPISLPASLP